MKLPVLGAKAANLQSAGSHRDPATSVANAWGQVGSDVTAVRFRVDGREVTATVGHGIWSAWWPGILGAVAPTTATVTYRNGNSATITLPQA